MNSMTNDYRRAGGRVQRGAASLLVVVLLFVTMALIVMFTNRGLILEQKTSANQYRSTLAIEAAEAGLEWAVAMLNKPEKIDASCATSSVAADVRFKQKYLITDTTNGALTPRPGAVHAACVANQNGDGWTCSCPVAGTAPAPAAAAVASGFRPSFSIVFQADAALPTGVRVTSFGCTGPITSDVCSGDAAATVSVGFGPISALPTPPNSPLTARGTVSIGNAALGVINSDPTANGITINAGMGINAPNVRITTVPGTPPQSTLVGNDEALRNTTEAEMFSTFFGMTKEAYRALPTVKQLNCPCTENDVQNAYNAGARQLWLNGDLVMNSNATIGSETDPFVLVAEGAITMRGDMRVFGVFYSAAMTWDNTGGGSGLLQGAAIAEGNYTGNGTPDYFYDSRVLGRLRFDAASFVRIPGSWRDF